PCAARRGARVPLVAASRPGELRLAQAAGPAPRGCAEGQILLGAGGHRLDRRERCVLRGHRRTARPGEGPVPVPGSPGRERAGRRIGRVSSVTLLRAGLAPGIFRRTVVGSVTRTARTMDAALPIADLFAADATAESPAASDERAGGYLTPGQQLVLAGARAG